MKTRTREHNLKIAAAHRARGVGSSPNKACPRCKESKPRNEFRPRSNGHTGSYCLPCDRAYRAERSRRYWKAHPERRQHVRRVNRRVKLKHYGMTYSELERMTERQGGRCAICNRPPRQRALDVDHCHATGKVRGLLCSSCNRLIGFADEDVGRLVAVIRYLTQAKEAA